MAHENDKIGGRAEHPGSDEQKISEMLGTLNRVEAPKDFDLHLKARIARARPVDHRWADLFPILKYAMPLGLFLAVGVGVFLASSYNSELDTDLVSQPASPVVEAPAPAPSVLPVVQPPTNSVSEPPRFIASESPSAGRRSPAPETPRSSSNRNVPVGGSRDFTPTDKALKVAPTPRTPTGMSLNPQRLDEAFRLIEAEAEFESGSWVVKGVKSNGIADQMGLKMGDKVRAIDGKPVGERTEFPGSFRVRTIQVQRDGTTVELGGAKNPD